MQGYESRKREFDEAVRRFTSLTKPTADDYLTFIVEAQKCFKQGLGLSWDDIESIVRSRVK